jgi:disulfide bond formation protein DsbB
MRHLAAWGCVVHSATLLTVTAFLIVARRHWPLFVLAVSVAMLATAHLFEHNGLAPCALCLRQREVYWGAMAVAAAGVVLPRFWANPLLPRTVCAFLGIAFLAGAGVALYHAGVEYNWWAGPSDCASIGGPVSVDDIARMLGTKTTVVPCDEAAWRDPVIGLSMAGWNGLISGALAGFSFFAAARPVDRGAPE